MASSIDNGEATRTSSSCPALFATVNISGSSSAVRRQPGLQLRHSVGGGVLGEATKDRLHQRLGTRAIASRRPEGAPEREAQVEHDLRIHRRLLPQRVRALEQRNRLARVAEPELTGAEAEQ